MGVVFKRVCESDRELYLSLTEKFYNSDAVLHPTDTSLHTKIFDELLRSDEYLVAYLFDLDGQTAGYALLSKSFSPEVGGKILWIEQLYINESFRRKGIAKEFLRFIEKEHPASRIRLEVEKDNKNAIKLYESYGYSWLPYLQMKKDFDK